jgi:hypothetical protein
MTGPGAAGGGNPGDRKKGADVGGADAVPDTPSTAKRQGAEPNAAERRLTPRAATATSSGSGIKPIVWIVVAIVVIAAIVYGMGLV